METDSSLIAGVSFAILVSSKLWMFHELTAKRTKRIQCFCCSKAIFQSLLSLVFLIFTIFYSMWMNPLSYPKDLFSPWLLLLCNHYFGFPPLHKKTTKCCMSLPSLGSLHVRDLNYKPSREFQTHKSFIIKALQIKRFLQVSRSVWVCSTNKCNRIKH